MKLVLPILKIQMKIGVQPEQMQMENMLEEVDIMESAGKIVQLFDKKLIIMLLHLIQNEK